MITSFVAIIAWCMKFRFAGSPKPMGFIQTGYSRQAGLMLHAAQSRSQSRQWNIIFRWKSSNWMFQRWKIMTMARSLKTFLFGWNFLREILIPLSSNRLTQQRNSHSRGMFHHNIVLGHKPSMLLENKDGIAATSNYFSSWVNVVKLHLNH